MKSCRTCIAVIVVLLFSGIARAQTDTTRDETKIYRDIQEAADKGSFSRFLHRIFFKPVNVARSQKKKQARKTDLQRRYSGLEGRIIRDIHIQTLDPFGYSLTDTSRKGGGFWYDVGNGTHVKTQRITISNLLLFKRNEPFDSLLVLESERLIRKQDFVHEVLFYARATGDDSVDIYIRELDNWSIVPRFSGHSSGFKVDVTEKNFLGFGHRFQNIFVRDFSEGNDFTTLYTVPNFRNTYVSTSVTYSRDRFGNTLRGLSVDRPFFSSFARWAGGAALSTQEKNDSLAIGSLEYQPVYYRFRIFDTWVGYAHRLMHGNTENARITRMVYALRYIQMRYLERPVVPDSLPLYANENMYLASIGVASPKYVPEKYVFKFGVTEDIPIGKIISITGGYQERKSTERTYVGMRFGYGNYTNLGYIAADVQFGSFFRSGRREEGMINAGIVYFTSLADVGRWKFRQFIKPQLSVGLDRLPTEQIEFHRTNGMGGFSSVLFGDKRFVLTLQTQSYAPWNLLGFRFGPYLVYSMGMLADQGVNFGSSRVYHQISLGILLRNDYLVFNNIQFSVSFFPEIPGIGENVVKMNARTTTDFALQDFSMTKPGIVPFE
jgi:hypothetical protein